MIYEIYNKENNSLVINKAISSLNNNEIVIIPTDTVYGLASMPNPIAIDKLYIAKNRDISKKIIALISDVDKLPEIIEPSIINDIYKYTKYWPGAISIILPINKEFKKQITDKYITNDTIGIRIPDNELAREIIRKSGGILMVTSANISGEDNITDELLSKVSVCIYDKGNKISGKASTIIAIEGKKTKIIRQGDIVVDFDN